jgi:hypothetical protein
LNYIYLQGWLFAVGRGYKVWGIRARKWLQSLASNRSKTGCSSRHPPWT